MFGSDPAQPASPAGATPLTGEIDKSFQPVKGTFFRTREYPEKDENEKVTGKVWMEAGYDSENKSWVLWQKSIRQGADILQGGTVNVLSARALFEKTDFVNAFDQMMTFEIAQKSLSNEPLANKTAAKLGGDYFKQFAWREGLMMSNSGRLYPMSADNITAANHFDAQDIADAKEFLERLRTEQFVPVPIVLPASDWAKAYAADKQRTDERLNVLYYRYGGDKNNHALALQIAGQETPEVLYAHIQQGFSPKIFEDDPVRHFALVKAAIDRPSVESLNLLCEAGASFYVRQNGETPLELALKQHRYSHLYVMLSRDGATLANYCDDSGKAPAVAAIELQDRQAFHMLYLEGLDYTQIDKAGMALVHHAFEHSFIPGIYAWLDEGLPIDEPVKGTEFTGLSIARRKHDQPLIDFALKKGANPNAPEFPAPAPLAVTSKPLLTAPQSVAPPPAPAFTGPFSIDMLNSAATNKDIETAATAYAASGGSFNLINPKGVSLFETCWKNHKASPDLDRRTLIPVLGKLGADASALLSDGTTVLTRATSGITLDLDFLKAIAPFVKDVNSPDANGNNVLHTLQMNANEIVAHSNNVGLVIKLFPDIDLNRQNVDGFSNIGVAIRLNRSQTLKNIPSSIATDWSQTTKSGWSLLDIAFTAAAGLEKVTSAPRADKITVTSDATRNAVLDMLDRTAKTGNAGQKQALSAAFNHLRPDGKTLAEVLAAESASDQIVSRLKFFGMPAPKHD